MLIRSSKTLKIRFNVTTFLFITFAFGLGYLLGLILSGDWCDDSCCRRLEKSSLARGEQLNLSKSYASFFIVIIFSGPKNRDRRDIIRSTWLKTKNGREILHFFVIGTGSLPNLRQNTLEEEEKEHGDIMFLPEVKDYYTGLSVKLLYSLIWLDKHVNFKFVLKVDDDSFARLDVIHDRLEVANMDQRLYWGFFDGRARIKRNGQWNEKNWFLCDNYLPYAKGGGYVLSSNLVQFIAYNAKFFQLYNSEDVSLGVWLSPLNVTRIHDPNFDTEYQSRGCFNSYLVTHKQSLEQMKEKYRLLKENGQLCHSEHRRRLSYIYNWKVPPSLCCIRNDTNIP